MARTWQEYTQNEWETTTTGLFQFHTSFSAFCLFYLKKNCFAFVRNQNEKQNTAVKLRVFYENYCTNVEAYGPLKSD